MSGSCVKTWLPALLLLVASPLAVVWAAARPPADATALAAVFPPWWSGEQAFAAASAVAALSPEAAWKADIAKSNAHFATEPHAVLKIQDAAYMRDGDTATLIGTKEKPETYHWVKGSKVAGALIAGVRGGHLFVVFNKRLYAEPD